MKVVDLEAQRKRLGKRLEERMNRVLAHGQFILGPEVAELEQRLRTRLDAAHVVTCGNGTDALSLALLAHGVGPGDLVVVPAFSYVATASAVLRVGARPLFVDVRPDDAQLDLGALELALDEARRASHAGAKIRGVIGVGLYGIPADIPELLRIAGPHGVFVLEDGAQTLGARRAGIASPGQGPCGVSSFFPSKPLGCYGDGGVIVCASAEMAADLRTLRAHGKASPEAPALHAGINSRLDTLQAAILLAKLDVFDDELATRHRLGMRYLQELARIPGIRCISPPQGVQSTWAGLTVAVAAGARVRDGLVSALTRNGVPARIYYPRALHREPVLARLLGQIPLFPVAETLACQVLTLPLHPDMTEADVIHVKDLVEEQLRTIRGGDLRHES